MSDNNPHSAIYKKDKKIIPRLKHVLKRKSISFSPISISGKPCASIPLSALSIQLWYFITFIVKQSKKYMC